MTAYLHRNYCGLGDRIVIHPKGLPPGWTESNLSKEGQERALAAAEGIVASGATRPHTAADSFANRAIYGKLVPVTRRDVLHLNPETLELIEALPLQ
jgi:hypothetical protein